MRPPSARSGSSFWVRKKRPLKCIAKIASNVVSRKSVVGLGFVAISRRESRARRRARRRAKGAR
jgi:hypothetical protein